MTQLTRWQRYLRTDEARQDFAVLARYLAGEHVHADTERVPDTLREMVEGS